MAAKRQKVGFTLIELLVVIAIISLLVSILLPSLSRARDIAKTLVCATKLKSQAMAFQFYIEANDVYPPSYGGPGWGTENNWKNILINSGALTDGGQGGELKAWGNDLPEAGLEFFECPSFELETTSRRAYGDYVFNRYNMAGDTATVMGLSRRRLGDIQVSPSELISVVDGWALEFVYETHLAQWAFGSVGRLDFERHRGVANALFCDGHVEGIAEADISASMFEYK